jgi:uncharacterized protein (DUF58 family)
LPKPVTLPAFSLRGKGQQQHQPEQSSYHQGQSGEFASLRDYQSGDSLKSIHWKSSAKTGELKVIEVQEEISTSIALVFDTQIQDEVDFETALRVACSLCQNLSNQHQSIELLFVDENVHHVRCGRGAHPSIDGLKALALAEGQAHNSSNVLKNSITEQLHQLSSVLLVTSLWQTEQRELTQWCEDRGCPVAVCCICEEPPLESARPQSQQWIQVHPSRLDDDLSQLRAWTT